MTAIPAMFWLRSSWASHALLFLTFVLSAIPVSLSVGSATIADPPRKSNGFTDVVQWDNYTLFVNNQRIFLQYVRSSRLDTIVNMTFLQLGRVPHLPSPGTRPLAGHLPEDGRGGA